ncbi:hypothetical protein [Streptomyces sp. NPDC059262]|uniref:hypothetical protein n=1 Tax=Streptomyces sp. NPDC059262 TaxID=3346797 RepID=UPI00368FEE21
MRELPGEETEEWRATGSPTWPRTRSWSSARPIITVEGGTAVVARIDEAVRDALSQKA